MPMTRSQVETLDAATSTMTLSLDAALYPRDVLYAAAYVFLDRAYVQGANVNACASAPGEPRVNPSTPGFLGCLKGWFVRYIYPGDVDPTASINSSTVLSIQLVK